MGAIIEEVATDHCQETSLKDTPLTFGQTFTVGDTRLVMVFGLHTPRPEWGFTVSNHKREFYNSGSIVMRLEYRNRSILFCGDTVGRLIGDPPDTCEAAEKAMVDNNGTVSIDCDVIIAPHHGGDNGSSTQFIQKASPRFVIFSAGTRNQHPRQSTAERYLANGVAVGCSVPIAVTSRIRMSGQSGQGRAIRLVMMTGCVDPQWRRSFGRVSLNAEKEMDEMRPRPCSRKA